MKTKTFPPLKMHFTPQNWKPCYGAAANQWQTINHKLFETIWFWLSNPCDHRK